MLQLSPDYPRPDFVRPHRTWKSLNGPWDFLFDDKDVGISQDWHSQGIPKSIYSGTGRELIRSRKIEVPFVFQSRASGINDQGIHEVLWYERKISDLRSGDEVEKGYRLLLRFGAVDYSAKVWLNGYFVGEHRGGHVPFDLDITEALYSSYRGAGNTDHRLTVRVYDSAHDLTQPRGKQYWDPKPESIFYTPSSGIWQSVWLESVPSLRIANSSHGTIIRSHDIEAGRLDARIAVIGRRAGQKCHIEFEASLAGELVFRSVRIDLPSDEDFVRLRHNMRMTADQLRELHAHFLQRVPLDDHNCWRDGVALWSPEHPILYNIGIHLFDENGQKLDEVHTTTGMRSIDWTTGDGTFRLNGQPYFQALLLDQGYWPETLMTPPSPEALKHDIQLSKAMGFNGCRKHQKVEDPVFMYWADKLGFLVWGEMASCYNFSVDYVDRFNQEWVEMVRRDINHPCIVAWTPANESWGYPDLANNIRQRDHLRSLYYMIKTLDWTRPINDNCGWEHVITDLSTFHDYADADGMAERCASVQSILGRGRDMFLGAIHGPGGEYDEGSRHQRGAPILCTEFGGVNVSKSNDEARKENWGYTTAKDSKDLLKRIENIMMATVGSGVVCGIVWTQFTDIEQEQNGLYTWDRREKLPLAQVKAIIDSARKTYHHQRR